MRPRLQRAQTVTDAGVVLDVETRASSSARIAPILAVRALAEGEAAIRPQRKALLPLADIVSVRIAGVSAPGVLPKHCSLDDLADGLAAVLDDLGLKRVNVCGTSHGGEIAYRFAVRHPERTGRVVLTGTTGHPRDHLPLGTSPAELAARMKGPARHGMADYVASTILCQDPALPVRGRAALRWVIDDLVSHTDDQQIDIWIRCMELLRNAPEPTPITAPLLAVTGEHDVASRPSECRALAALSSPSVFATIKEADHFVFLTRAREHLDVTRRFLLDQPLTDLPFLAALEAFPRPSTPMTPHPASPSA
ncbi:alpha/beta hydrolase [Streptomyces sp. NBC_00237]|uniref:alpha/beta fold hydrolase n=1 Tax=Streptomyces sp. NBC_00237 TaxID=2975687 RepID=UPI00224E7B82|nr:alpha/beta hydrolase [Streptomyces sp. NBC_00237]MCX5205726.1 alpha/beta hydrolase [Streptomyces sp. NBC_00237]